MSSLQARIHFTEEEYLEIERASEEKHEYIDGRIYAMAGESEDHNTICVNLASEIRPQLKHGTCRVFSKDMKARSGPEPKPFQPTKGFFSYPDVLVVCGERQYHDKFRDVLLNPQVIIEVISKSTEAFDRGEKFLRYRTWLPTFTDYVLVSQSAPIIEHYRRQENGEWVLTTSEGLDASLRMGSIGCTLKLNEVYDGVAFSLNATDEITERVGDY
jgi:Uma2 family endonuclease